MFARVLFADQESRLCIDWLGMGALVAQHHSGLSRRAHKLQRRYFLTMCAEFEKLGEALTPANPRFALMAQTFADALLNFNLNGIAWKVWFTRGPAEMAREFATA